MNKIYALGSIMLTFLCSYNAIAQENYIKRVNCGATSAATFEGNTFDADVNQPGVVTYDGDRTSEGSSYFTLSQPHKSIRYTKNPSMYYKFFVDNGQYQVVLHFAESYHGVQPGTNPDTRKFNLDIDSQHAFTDLNVISLAGGANQIYKLDRVVDVTDGEITLTFSKGSGNDPIINAIEVLGIDNSDSQDPTAPTLSSSGQTDSSVDLTWSGATDNLAVTGYKVYKDGTLETTLGDVSGYQVIDLTEQTTYQFTVTALDAAGNESTSSNAVSITTNASSGGSGGSWAQSGSNIYYNAGSVGIGTVNPGTWKLAVNGNIRAKEIKVETGWADYVFKDDYELPSLKEVKDHIEKHGHLINIPSAADVEANGVLLGEMDKLLLEKVEELTLYLLAQDKALQTLKTQNTELQKLVDTLSKKVDNR